MKIIRLVDDYLAKAEKVILIFLLVIMLGLGFLQVVLRNFFGSGIHWADLYLRHSVLWIGLIGASLATKNEKHINMDALSRILSPKLKNTLDIFLNFIACSFSVLFVYASYIFVKDEYDISEGKAIFLGLQAWMVELIIPVAFGIIAFRFLVKALEKIAEIFNKDTNKAE